MRQFRLALLGHAGFAVPIHAGSPYLTDNPVPTNAGHWELDAFTGGEGRRADLDEDVDST